MRTLVKPLNWIKSHMSNLNRGFNEILAEIDSGILLQMLSAAMAQVTNGVQNSGKAGKLTLTLTIKPNKGNAVFVSSDIKKHIPEIGVETASFFADDEGNLSRRNPQQQELFGALRAVE